MNFFLYAREVSFYNLRAILLLAAIHFPTAKRISCIQLEQVGILTVRKSGRCSLGMRTYSIESENQ